MGREPLRFAPLPADELERCVGEFETYRQGPRRYDPLVDALLVHYQLHAIHPFRRSNDSVARLLLAESVADWCDLSTPWLYLSSYFLTHRDAYFERMLAVSAAGDWEAWIEFGLEAVLAIARDAESRTARLLQIHQSFLARIEAAGASSRSREIIDYLFESPMLVIPQLASCYDVTYPTARADVERLIAAGILEETPEAAQRTFVAARILSATYDDLEEVD